MAMTCRNNIKRDSIILDTINNLVPPDHMVRKLEKAVDWKFIYPLVKDLYSSEGRPSVKRGEIRKQAKSLKSSRLWTAGKQVTTE